MGQETQRLITKEEPNRSRPSWKAIFVVIGGIVVHLSFGASYIMGNFIPYIASYMKFKGEMPNIMQTDMVWVAAANEVGFGVFMFLSGSIERMIGSRLCILLCSFLMSFSILLSSYTVRKDLLSFAITDGFITGIAVSIVYPITLRLAMKWMPSRKSTVSGLVLAGHGASSVIFTQVVTAYVNPENFKPDVTIGDEKYFDNDILLERVPWCFILLGCSFLSLQVIGTAMISPTLPDDGENETAIISANRNGHLPRNRMYTSEADTSKKQTEIQLDPPEETVIYSLRPKEILKTRQFYILWFICILNGQSILFLSGLYKAYGQTFIHDDHFLAVIGSIAAVGNTVGRPLWGVFADKFGEKKGFIAIALLLTTLKVMNNLSESTGKYYFLFIVFSTFLTGTGTYSILSSATYKCFGPKYYSTNFGLVFTSQAVAGILSSTLASNLKAKIGWHGMFGVTTGMAVMSVILSSLYCNKCVDPLASPVEQNNEDCREDEEATPVAKKNKNVYFAANT